MNNKLSNDEKKVYDAVVGGALKIEDISEVTGMSRNVAHLIAGNLCKLGMLRKNPKDKSFIIGSLEKGKVICYGDILQPVKFYINPDTGQRYAIRGTTWNPIADDISEHDIEWVDTADQKAAPLPKGTKDRSHMSVPTDKIILPSKFENWACHNIKRGIKKRVVQLKHGIFSITLHVNETRDTHTHVYLEIKYTLGKKAFSKFEIQSRTDVLIESKLLISFLNGSGLSPFQLVHFMCKPTTGYPNQFPIDQTITPSGGVEMTTFNTLNLTTTDAMKWNVNEYKNTNPVQLAGKFKKLESFKGTIDDMEIQFKDSLFMQAITNLKGKN